MAKRQIFLNAVWTERWQESYSALSVDLQDACDDAAIGLIKQEYSSGLRVKPIQPDKYFLEARVSSAVRIVFRVESGSIHFVDVVSHDDIGRYGRRPRSPR